MIQRDGMWWPDSDVRARPIITGDCERDVGFIMPYIEGRDCIVQAGGNVGVYPLALADHFKKVVTFEPDPSNYACLDANLEARDGLGRVVAFQSALGEKVGHCFPIVVEPDNCGANRVGVKEGGPIPIIPLDNIRLNHCDAIWLDVEGFEIFALKGAERTIRKFWPVIICEEKSLGEVYGVDRNAIETFLEGMGYELTAGFHNDRLYVRAS